jgi:hypothetical protein
MKNFTIVIQGPQDANSASAANAHRYLEVGDVVVSCWAGNDVSGFEGLPVKIVQRPLPDTSGVVNDQNIYFQCTSSLNGLGEADTEFSIKVRSDEAYTDLMPMIREIMANPEKLVTNNTYFRRDREWKFHPSDHVIGGRTDTLKGTFSILKQALETHDTEIAGPRPAEQRIFLSFLRYKGIRANWAQSKETMRTWCGVVPSRRLGSIIWSDSWGQHRVDSHYIKCIEDI